jgi:hypothetical protein
MTSQKKSNSVFRDVPLEAITGKWPGFLVPVLLTSAILSSSDAVAYAGQQLLEYAGSNIIGPIAVFAIVIGLVATKFRPQYASQAWSAAIAGAFVFFVIRFAPTIISAMST